MVCRGGGKLTTGEGSQVLERSGLGGSSGNNDGVLHGIILLKSLDKLGNSRSLLTDGDVDAVQLLGLVVGVVPPLLVENGIQGDSGLSGLTITNNQLTLATADGNHSIDGLETGLDGLVDRLTGQNAGSLELSTALLLAVDGALAVDRVTEGIDDTTKHLGADRDIDLRRVNRLNQCIVGGTVLTISPVRLTVSPSLTRRSEPKSTTPTWPASRFMHMPLTPEANLYMISYQ